MAKTTLVSRVLVPDYVEEADFKGRCDNESGYAPWVITCRIKNGTNDYPLQADIFAKLGNEALDALWDQWLNENGFDRRDWKHNQELDFWDYIQYLEKHGYHCTTCEVPGIWRNPEEEESNG